ncbi:MAG: methylated-DNA--[protein]-cysteine S-methyltransferase [Candidatus Nitrohelix vancouverensis]|uniref:Methylated-DNA--protein-cysteine methyltransferase n=1 Tax=Candidatus Nitrohelix vancouverensis TaxID=2705534 RepID=A0A7T0C3I1_9BACT|nr:MAG: methylated-DNA--[protein]-cysteine S-methyltransferase [Candidatus Nitrohelix vancouverensis]
MPKSIDSIQYALFETPLGLAGLADRGKGVCRLKLQINSIDDFINELEEQFNSSPRQNQTALRQGVKQVEQYFSGKLKRFDCKLDLGHGTDFQKSVWRQVLHIPYGKTQSYQWLAEASKRPRAYRAAGSANGRNPIPLIIPCHRVIRHNGELGGYTGGIHIKRFLLDLESGTHGTV